MVSLEALARAESAYFIDRSLFAYRWHASNQTAQQAGSGALKYLVDEYAATFEIDSGILKELGIARADIERAFIEHDIGRHGLAELVRGRREGARRVYLFGRAAYPALARANRRVRVLGLLLTLGPCGQLIARSAYRYVTRRARRDPANAWQSDSN